MKEIRCMPSSTKPPDNPEEQDEVRHKSHIRVRLVVETDVDGCDDDDLRQLFGPEKIRQSVRQAVDNALHAAHEDGFNHDLCEEVAIFIAAVHLLEE
jgi:hypothetical protein